MAIERATTDGRAPDFISASRATGPQLRAFKAKGAALYPNSRARIAECRAMMTGASEAPIPSDIAKDVADSMKVRHAGATTTPLRMANLLASDRCKLKRNQVAYGRNAGDIATEIEIYANAALELDPPYGFPHYAWCDLLLNEGEAALIVAPRMAHWEDTGGRVLDARGKPIDFESYRDRKVPGGSTSSRKNGARAYRIEEDIQLARRFPVHMRAISAQHCYPFFGSGGDLTGLLVWSTYSALELVRAGFIWSSMKRHLTPSAGGLGLMDDVEVLEWWSTDLNEDPYVAYSIEGAITADLNRSDDPDGRVAVVNLRKECGITRLPVAYMYGQYFEDPNYDMRGVPFTWPWVNNWKASNALATATVYAGWRNGFLSFALKRGQRNLPPGAGLELSQPKTIEIAPNKIIDIGDAEELIPLRHEGVGPDVTGMIQHLNGDAEKTGPGEGAFGGDAPSMADRALSRAYVRDAVGHVVESQRRGYEFAGEMVLEIVHAIGTKYRPVPLAVNTETPPKTGGRPSPTTAIVTLDPDTLGTPPVFDVTAEWPHVPGENLATAQQWLGFVEKGTMLTEEFRELAMGDTSPERFRARKVIEDFYNSPEGRADLLEYAAQKLSDKKLAERFKMQQNGLLNENAVPQGMLAGAEPPQPGMLGPGPGGDVPGVGIPNAARSQLGGITGGAIAAGARMAGAEAGPAGPGMV